MQTLTTTTKNVTNATFLAIERVQKAVLIFFIHTIFILHLKFFLFNFDLITTCFVSASNAGSALFLSTNSSAGGKTLITYVDGGFPTKKYEYDRYKNFQSDTVSIFYLVNA